MYLMGCRDLIYYIGSKLSTFCNRNEPISQQLQWAQKSVFEGISSSIKVRGHTLTTLSYFSLFPTN